MNNSTVHVAVVEISTGKQLRGDDAPLASQLNAWLDSHPGWEIVDDSEDEDDQDEDNMSRGKCNGFDSDLSILGPKQPVRVRCMDITHITDAFYEDRDRMDESRTKDVLRKAKVEDDEYKCSTEEHTYYRFVILIFSLQN